MSQHRHRHLLTAITLCCQECPKSSSTYFKRFTICSAILIIKTSKRVHASPLKVRCLPLAQRIEYKAYSMCYDVLSKTAPPPLPTCLTCFTCTPHPVHCVPLLTPALLGFQNERKCSKGNALFPACALSHGINCHTLYAMLQQNPSSKLNLKPHYSSQPME